MSYKYHNRTYYYKYTVYKYVMCLFLKQSLYESTERRYYFKSYCKGKSSHHVNT